MVLSLEDPIDKLGLSRKYRNAIGRKKIRTIGELVNADIDVIDSMYYVGMIGILDIYNTLIKHGFSPAWSPNMSRKATGYLGEIDI